MADQQRKRVAPVAAPPGGGVPAVAPPARGAARPPRTLRLAMHLSQSNERECPVFNYKELVSVEEGRRRAEKEKRKGTPPNGIWDAFSDNDEDVERIAKQFEQKYGSSSTYGKSKGRSKRDDYADIGAGYDENDSFIDNTDGYDEIIPPECDTACGGFYINSGSLEFKNVTGTGLSTGEGAAGDSSPPAERKSHKRPLSSSESEEESSSSEDDTEGSATEKPTEQSIKDGKTNSVTDSDKSGEDGKQPKSEKIKEPRKKRKNSQEGSASSGQENSVNGKTVKNSAENASNAGLENHNEASSDSRSSAVPSSDNHASSDSSREAVPVLVPVPVPVPTPTPTPTQTQTQTPTIQTSTPVVPPNVLPDVLPSDLPAEILLQIQRLKKLSDMFFASRTGKLSGPEVNDIILAIELQCRRNKIASRLRHALYGHAAQLLRRGKAGLLQHARRLAEDHQRNTASRSPIEKLKEIIDKMKPSLLETYHVESQKIVEINKQIVSQNALLEDDKKIQERRLPKRRFPWDDNVRSILQDVVRSRGIDCGNNDEEIIRFLQSVILPLFPPGFVRMPTLLQQVKNAKTQKAAIDSSVVKKITNKSLETKQVNISQLSAPNKAIMKNLNDSNKDNENATQAQSKLKLQMNSIGTELSEHPEPSKTAETKTESKNNNDRVCENGNETDKNIQMKAFNDSLQAISDNISISITSVYPKKCDSEKTATPVPVVDKLSAVDSVIIKPSDKFVQQHSKTGSESISLNNSSSVIKSVESLAQSAMTSPNQSLVGSLKVKPTSSLFDKSTIAKIISGKNTGLEVNKYTINDASKLKAFAEASSKHMQDVAHLKRAKSGTVLPLSDSNTMHIANNLLKSANNQVLKSVSVVLTDNFAKPHYKTDLSTHSNKVSNSSVNSSSQSKYKDNSFHGNQKDSNHQNNDHNHSFVKPSVAKSSDFANMSPIVNDNLTSQKHMGIIRHVEHEPQNFMMKLNNSEDKKPPVNQKAPSTTATHKAAVLNLDDSSSDDCVEVVAEDEVNKSIISKMMDNRIVRDELIRRQILAQSESLKPKEKYQVSKTKVGNVDVAKIKRDKWYPNSNMPIPNVLAIQNENSDKIVSVKKIASFMKLNEPETKKAKHDGGGVEIIVEEDPLRDVADHLFNNVPLNSVVTSETYSVIHDKVSAKSDRIMDTVPNDSAMLQFDKEDQEIDFNRVMQDLKELQDLQMRSDGNHQRLYEDPSNNICHTSYSETENKIYIKHKEAREKM